MPRQTARSHRLRRAARSGAVRIAVVLLASLAPACAAPRSIIGVAPPAVRGEVRPPRPSPSYVWVPGHWRWRDDHHTWIPGRWVEGRPGKLFVPGHWKHAQGGWVWEPGRWESA